MPKSLLDEDFIDEGDNIPFPEPEEVQKPQKPAKDDAPIEIEVVDDTPEPDKGRPVAPLDTAAPENDDEEEIKNYSERFQKRLHKETAKVHQYRRAAEERDRQLAEAAAHLKRVMLENNNLKGVVESGEKVLIGEHKTRLESELARARAAYREATEAGDTNGIIAAQENLSRAVAQLDRLSQHRPQTLPREDFEAIERQMRTANQQVEQTQVPQVDPKAKAWAEKNKWFDNDIPMQAYALGVHKQIVENEGVTSGSDEYYSRIDREMRKRFPDRFAGEPPPRRQGAVVAPATRTGLATPRKVTLTESQVRLAKRLGLTPQQYAEQVLIESKNDGRDFTHSS